MADANILLADDHEVLRRGLRGLIETRPGWRVCGEASDGRQAVVLAAELRPDVVVMDLSMPGLHGLEATRQIRRALPRTEILIFTVHNDERTMRAALQAGARGYVLKSDVSAHLLAAIESLSVHHPFLAGAAAETVLGGFLHATAGASGDGGPLTGREREVVQLVAEGMTNKAIAERLAISPKTVDGHRTLAMRKLGIHSTAELVRYALRNGMVQ